MKTSALMIQGTTSDAGKSIVAAALCRILSKKGVSVAPFKGQNMALNSYATLDGGEIGRAQALQAQAAGVEPSVDMNPVLLKPAGDSKSQVIIRGKVFKTLTARDYYAEKTGLVKVVRDSLNTLMDQYDVVIIEGAGSPAEINLKHEDIANMGVAKMANAPVLLIGDINRGGVFASLLGTVSLLEADERALIKGLIINKFRGDETLLDTGIDFIKDKTGIPFLGTIPYIHDIKIDNEDSLAFDSSNYRGCASDREGLIDVAVVRLDHISNFTDFDPLAQSPYVNLRYVSPREKIGGTDCVIIPGTKSTITDLKKLFATGIAEEIIDLNRKGVMIIGICGGFQMLGKYIEDPLGVESDDRIAAGMSLLDCKTVLTDEKITEQVEARILNDMLLNINNNCVLSLLTGEIVKGYEIHTGETVLGPSSKPTFEIIRRGRFHCSENGGAVSGDGMVIGTYIHGLFDNDNLRNKLINYLVEKKDVNTLGATFNASDNVCIKYDDFKQKQIEKLVKTVENSLDMDYIFSLLDMTGVTV